MDIMSHSFLPKEGIEDPPIAQKIGSYGIEVGFRMSYVCTLYAIFSVNYPPCYYRRVKGFYAIPQLIS